MQDAKMVNIVYVSMLALCLKTADSMTVDS